MKVLNADVTKVDFGNKMKAFVDFTFSLLDEGNGCIQLRGFRLFDGANGHFLAFPSEKVTVKNKETGQGEVKWFDRMYIDKEVPEGQALIDAMTEAAVTEYNSQGAAKAKGSNNSTDIPW